MQIVSMGKKKFSADYQLMFRLLKLFLFIGFISTLVVFFLFLNLTVGDLFVCLLAFMPTGWALLSVRSLSLHLSLNLFSLRFPPFLYPFYTMLCTLILGTSFYFKYQCLILNTRTLEHFNQSQWCQWCQWHDFSLINRVDTWVGHILLSDIRS